MSLNDFIKLIYMHYGKSIFGARETAKLCNLSYSKFTKYFGGHDAITEEVLIKENIVPQWFLQGKRRMWKIEEIFNWRQKQGLTNTNITSKRENNDNK